MARNWIHKIESGIFKSIKRYTFLDYGDAENLFNSLHENIKNSGYKPDVIVNVLSGAYYVADKLSERMNIPITYIAINHYGIKIWNKKIKEIIGAGRIARLLGYKFEVTVEKDVCADDVKNKKVLIVDEDSYSGLTLEAALKTVKEKMPLEARTAVLLTHDKNTAVNFSGKIFEKEKLYSQRIRFPWSRISPFYKNGDRK